MRSASVALVLTALLATSSRAWTLDEALALGLEKGRTPRRIRSELAAARSLFGTVGARFRPEFEAAFEDDGERTLTASKRLADETRVTARVQNPPDSDDGQTYSLDLFLPVFRTQALQLVTAEYNWEATRRRQHQALEDYKLALVRDFYAVRRARSQLEVRRQAVERWDLQLESARFRADIGVRSKLDFWNTKVNQANAVVARIRAEQAWQKARDQLANRLGIPFEEVEEVEEELRFEPFGRAAPEDWSRADLEAQRYEVRLAGASLDAARRAARPDLALDLNLTKVDGSHEEGQALLRYRWQFGRRREYHQLDLSRQALTQARIAEEQLRADIVEEQRDAARVLEATARSLAVAKESLELAELSYEASRIQFEGGRITQIEFQNAQDKLTAANSNYESLIVDYKIARFRWMRAFGEALGP